MPLNLKIIADILWVIMMEKETRHLRQNWNSDFALQCAMKTDRSLAVCRHQFTKRCVLFDLEVYNAPILARHFQIDVFVTLKLQNKVIMTMVIRPLDDRTYRFQCAFTHLEPWQNLYD